MAVMKGLATYELIKLGFLIYFVGCFLCCAIYGFVSNMKKNYQKTQGNIVTNTDNTQTLKYTVNNKEYTRIIPFKPEYIDSKTNVRTPPMAAYTTGSCSVYYQEKDPENYSININPTFMTGVISSILCFVGCFACLSFAFLNKNREVAGVMGGVDIASSLIKN